MNALEILEQRETPDLTYIEACILGAGQRKSTRDGATRAAAELAALKNTIGNLLIIIGNHTGEEIKCDTITEQKWIAAALKAKP
jgi:hypothetical protein